MRILLDKWKNLDEDTCSRAKFASFYPLRHRIQLYLEEKSNNECYKNNNKQKKNKINVKKKNIINSHLPGPVVSLM